MKIMIEMQVLPRMNDPRILEISLQIASREDRQTSSQTNWILVAEVVAKLVPKLIDGMASLY